MNKCQEVIDILKTDGPSTKHWIRSRTRTDFYRTERILNAMLKSGEIVKEGRMYSLGNTQVIEE